MISGRRGYGLAIACVIVAIGAIMLIRARGAADAAPRVASAPALDLSTAPPVADDGTPVPRVTFDRPGLSGWIALTQRAVLAGATRQVRAEVTVTADRADEEAERRPVALAVVLDTSGSMSGEKIEEAKQAVRALVDAMDGRDQIALVTYNSHALIVQNLAEVRSVRRALLNRVNEITAGGGTNIPSGLNQGTTALAGTSSEFTRRVVLISDGLDGSGASLTTVRNHLSHHADAGVTISSLGVGTDYSEPFLITVSDAGHGNYEFLASTDQLHQFLARELEQASSTKVEQIWVDLQLPPGWRVRDTYGVERRGSVGRVRVPFGALYSGEQRSAVITFDVHAGVPGQLSAVGVRLQYLNADEGNRHDQTIGTLAVRTVATRNEVLASRSDALHADTVTREIDARQARSIEAWREGRSDEALRLSTGNIEALQDLQAISFSQERAARIQEFNEDNDNFANNEAQSQAGRTYGLRSNQARWSRARGR
jgi:Ca-activated chloride channel family protein